MLQHKQLPCRPNCIKWTILSQFTMDSIAEVSLQVRINILFGTSNMSQHQSPKRGGGDEVFEITDFTTASPWERLIADIERFFRQWGLDAEARGIGRATAPGELKMRG